MPIQGIRRNVFFLGLVSLFNDISSEMLYPIVPIFLRDVLGAPMAVVGLIEGVAESTASILKGVSGSLSDKLGRRLPFVFSGYSFSALSKPILAVAYAWQIVLFARFLDRFGKGIRTSARDALIADSTDPAFWGKAFGFHRALDTLGAVIGPLLLLGLLFLIGEYRSIFFIAFIPAFLGVVLLLFVKEKKSRPKPLRFSFRGMDRNFKVFLIASIIFSAGNSSSVFPILRAKNIFEGDPGSVFPFLVTSLGFSMAVVAMAVLCYVVYNITYSLASLPAGSLSDRVGRRNLIAAGLGVFSIAYFSFAWVEEGFLLWGLFGFYGLYMAMTDGVGKAYIVDMAPREKGTALGLYYAATGTMALLASIIAGILWDMIGAWAPFVYGGLMAAIAAILMVLFLPGDHRD